MQLTFFTDYTFRVLIYLGNKKDKATVGEIAKNFKVSKNHLVKVVHQMSKLNLLVSTKGKGGGIAITERALSARLGDLVTLIEPDMRLVECFDKKTNECPIIGICRLEKLLYQARKEFIDSLNRNSLRDLVANPDPRIVKKLNLLKT
jgi:Rrf2 family nitric oxide-sensitive transcriptional repressor